MHYAIVDIETSPNRITEIAIIRHDGQAVTERFQTLINPGEFVSPYITRLTGITNDMLEEAPRFEAVAKKIMELTTDAVFVAHSVNFDYGFIREEFRNLGADFRRRKLCTVRLSKKVFPGHRSYSLGNICSALDIPIRNRHRAMGDAEATVQLFEKILQHDKQDTIRFFLKRESKEAVLPPNLPKEVFEKIPESTGVYYFHDDKGKVIYVGKALNIKKRLLQHFQGKGIKTRLFLEKIFDITYELTGTELIALLLESHEIKRLYPVYNRAQKTERGNWVLVDYTDKRGIHRLQVVKKKKGLQPLCTFKSFEAARDFMFGFIEEFGLCAKCCGVQNTPHACFDYQIKKCRGVCAGKEEIDAYNERVREGLEQFEGTQETRIIVDKGRNRDEKSVILIEKGVYLGFGYFDSSMSFSSVEEAREIIKPYQHNADVKRILSAYAG
ncbi:MAG: exonuclease domain-containing protein [Bacteroidota bacterium]